MNIDVIQGQVLNAELLLKLFAVISCAYELYLGISSHEFLNLAL